jgi:DNA-binding CsgD family transcriptional regulator
LAGGGERKKRVGRSYRPTLEAMEALRLLSGATAMPLSGLVAEHHLLADSVPAAIPTTNFPPVSGDTWDAALVQTHLAEILSGTAGAEPTAGAGTIPEIATVDTAAVNSGLTQLNKYLGRAWYRAGIPVQMHEDCSQAVFATLLQQLGRTRFDSLVGEIGQSGIKEVFSRETDEGIDFFRAVDMIKKRAQRERVFQPLDAVDVPASSTSAETRDWRAALNEAIDRSLSPREASLIHETLMGKTPAEIALHWGVAPKTISNEKTRVIQKLRDVLLEQEVG